MRFRRGFRPMLLGPDEVEFRTGVWTGASIAITDPKGKGRIPRLLAMIDGRRSFEEARGLLSPQESGELAGFVKELRRHGLLDESSLPPAPDALPESGEDVHAAVRAFLSLSTQDGEDAFRRLRSANVSVVGAGAVGAAVALALAGLGVGRLRIVDGRRVERSDLASSLAYRQTDLGAPRAETLAEVIQGRAQGTRLSTLVEEPLARDSFKGLFQDDALVVLAQDSPAPSVARKLNEASLDGRFPWTLVQLSGTGGIVGPTVLPWRSACHECAQARLAANASNPERHRRYVRWLEENPHESPLAAPPGFAEMLAGILIADVPSLVASRAGFTVGRAMVVDAADMGFDVEAVLKLPRCPACGRGARGHPNLQVYETMNAILSREGAGLYDGS